MPDYKIKKLPPAVALSYKIKKYPASPDTPPAAGASGSIVLSATWRSSQRVCYKKNMFALLGKPGYEAEKEALLKLIRSQT